jgi:serine/threonine protein kinase/WD40 repeat protein
MNESISKFEPVEELAEEFLDRYRRGERPALSEYTRRHPDLAALIHEYFPAMVVMEELGSVGGEGSKPTARTVMEGGLIPQELGEYRIVREIGRGGMGIVYEAVQESLGRHVALKVLPFQGLMNATYLERFRREARAAARLHHTNIVPVFGVGEYKGTHYYAMQFIHGQSLNEVLQELKRLRAHKGEAALPERDLAASVAEGLTGGKFASEGRAAAPTGADGSAGKDPEPRRAQQEDSTGSPSHSHLTSQPEGQYFRSVAQIGAQVADALDYAHGQGVLHRDIKPSNLILDVSGRVWVTDFGLAKADETDELTDPGDIVGTLCYMAPERFQGQADVRSDVYGLGITLYEMATLQPAFTDSQRARLIEKVTRTEPRGPRRLDARIPRDLETIILKATAKAPHDRYATAAALGEDLRRFLGDRPVRARRTPLQERVWRWCRRNPALACLAGAVVFLALIVAVVASFSAIRLREETNRAWRAEREATEELYRSYLAQARASRSSGQAGRRFDGLLALQSAAHTAEKLGTKDQHLLELRNEAIACLVLPDLNVAKQLEGNLVRDAGIGFDPQFDYYARGDGRGNISVRRTSEDREIVLLKAPEIHPSSAPRSELLRFSRDGRFLAVKYFLGHIEFPKLYRVWEWRNKRVVVEQAASGVVNIAVDFAPDSRRVAIAGQKDDTIRFYDLDSGKEIRRCNWGRQVQPVAFHPGGQQLALSTSDPTAIQVRDLATGKLTASWHTPTLISSMSWQPDGRLLAGGGDDGHIYTWDTLNGLALSVFEGHLSSIRNMHFFARGDLLASTGWDAKTRLWDLRSRQLLFSAPGCACGFSADDHNMAFFNGAQVGVWDIAAAEECRLLLSLDKGARGPEFSADNRLLAAAGDDGVPIWDVSSAKQIARLPCGKTHAVHFHPDGKGLVTSGQSGLLRWPIRREEHAGAQRTQIGPPELLMQTQVLQEASFLDAATWDLAGRWLGVIEPPERAVVIDLLETSKKTSIGPHGGLGCISISPDGRWAATGTWRRSGLKIWDIRTGKLAHEIASGGACGLFSPDGRWLVISTQEGYRFLHSWSWEQGSFIDVHQLRTHPGPMAFSRDSRLLAIAPSPWQIRLIETSTTQEIATLALPDSRMILSPCFSPDGNRLAALTEGGIIQLWDLRLLRNGLSNMGLDWELPPFLPFESSGSFADATPVDVVTGDLASRADTNIAHAHLEVGALSALLALNPFHLQAYLERARAYDRLRQWNKVIEDYTMALALVPLGDPARPSILARRSQAYQNLNDYSGAIASLQPEADRSPSDWLVCNNLAWLYVTGPELTWNAQKALPLAEKAVRLRPDNSSCRNTLGVVYYRLGRFDSAVVQLERSLREGKEADATYDLFFLAMAYARLGDASKARECYARGVRRMNEHQAEFSAISIVELRQLLAEARGLLAETK